MFSNKSYFEVNREERFYCTLYVHVLLGSITVRERFCNLIKNKFKIDLDASNLEIYVEIAALRDYWNALGDPKKYEDKTHLKRLAILETILRDIPVSADLINKYDFFWTNGTPKKLWSPGHWNIKNADTDELKKLQRIKWAFNAKPDLLIKSDTNVLMLEVKIESTEGCDGSSEYRQLEIQEYIGHLMKLLIPYFQNSEIKNGMLDFNGDKGISWKEVLETIEESDIDNFTWKCLMQLKSIKSKNKQIKSED